MSQLMTRPTGGAMTTANERPLVSAILVTRNSESHLRECVEDLMEQSVAHQLEVIVADLGSDQCEWAVVADLQRKYGNLHYLKVSAPAAGRGVNLALKMASGRYLTLIEATDRMRRDAFELLCAALKADPAAMVAYGDTCFTALPHETFASHTSYGKVIWPDYTAQQLSQLSEVAPHLLWRAELNDTAGFLPEGYPGYGMREFLLEVVVRFPIAHVPEFTGLRLMAGTAKTAQGAADATPAAAAEGSGWREPAQAAFGRPHREAATTVPAAEPAIPAPPVAAAPRQSADEAYLELRPLLQGTDAAKAFAAVREHLARYPQHAVAHNDLAALSYQLGDKEQSLKHYREAVWLEPGESVYLKNLADLLYVEAGQTDEAIGIYLKLLEKDPRDVETLLNLGIICEGVGRPAEAESFYLRALEVEPANQSVRESLTRLRNAPESAREEEDERTAEERYGQSQELVQAGDLAGAERELETILLTYPDFAPAHNDLAVLSYQKGEKEKAHSHYERAAALAPGNATFQKNLADFLFVEGGDVDGAIAIYLDQLQKSPRDIETLMGLGKICSILDRPQEAESFYSKVTQLEPWNRDARECLTTLRQAANG